MFAGAARRFAEWMLSWSAVDGARPHGSRRAALSFAVVVSLTTVILPSAASAQSPLTVAGPWRDLANGYTRGETSGEEFTLCFATDQQPGWIALEEIGVGYVWDMFPIPPSRATADAFSEDATSECPSLVWNYNGYLDSTTLTEGAHTYRGVGQPDAELLSEPWTVNVDRTPPLTPEAFSYRFDAVTNEATIEWAGVTDPDLADGTPGSGI